MILHSKDDWVWFCFTLESVFPQVILKLQGSQLPDSSQLQQYSIKCEEEDKFLLIYTLLRLRLVQGKTLVFVGAVDRCYRLKLFLEQFGIPACVLNSELPVQSRWDYVWPHLQRSVFFFGFLLLLPVCLTADTLVLFTFSNVKDWHVNNYNTSVCIFIMNCLKTWWYISGKFPTGLQLILLEITLHSKSHKRCRFMRVISENSRLF